MFSFGRKRRTSGIDDLNKNSQIDWDTVYGELTFALTMISLSMLFAVANLSAISADELDRRSDELSWASRFHYDNTNLSHKPELFVNVSWMAVWLCGSAWAVGLVLYVYYLEDRQRYGPDVAPRLFLKQYRWEIKAMYYLLMFSLVCAGVSSYFLFQYKLPARSQGYCRDRWNPNEEQKQRSFREERFWCFDDGFFFTFYSGVLWFPVTGVAILWMYRERGVYHAQLTTELRTQSEVTLDPVQSVEQPRDVDNLDEHAS